jgi:hypothetical protein
MRIVRHPARVLVACVAATLAACSSRPLQVPSTGGAGTSGGGGTSGGSGTSGGGGASEGGAPGQTVIDISLTVNRNVDVLFMIDNSSGGTPYQQKLSVSFPSYLNTLTSLPGGLPNLHIAVVSSSMGAGRSTDIPQCAPGGDRGVFQATPRAPCGATGLAPGQNFISNVNGMANYTGELATVFSCIAALGDQGCGFEHQLESILRALGADGAAAPPQNANFLRPNAFLQIVLLSDEDDCSAPPDSDLFDTSSRLVSDPLGPLQSFRCNEFGHLCGGKPPPRTMAADLSGTCVSNENGRLLRVVDVVAAIKHLKADPRKIFVAAISAPTSPYVVALGPSQNRADSAMWPYVQHSCMAADGSYGDPAVRIKQWVDAFGSNGFFEPICADSFAPVLQAIAGQIGKVVGPPCLDATIDATTCKLVDHTYDAQGQLTDVPLPPCDGSGQAACWSLVDDPIHCPTGRAFQLNRPAGPMPPPDTTATCKS